MCGVRPARLSAWSTSAVNHVHETDDDSAAHARLAHFHTGKHYALPTPLDQVLALAMSLDVHAVQSVHARRWCSTEWKTHVSAPCHVACDRSKICKRHVEETWQLSGVGYALCLQARPGTPSPRVNRANKKVLLDPLV